ncbi:MAG TPA: 4Fe-4S dicluster domain-containing protein [Chloroflexota bacterium]|nr:4Fe-4S dicluster domain-containing protein [Chloroflexota bacterium]
MAKMTMLYDSSKCVGCRACQVACKQWNDLPAERTSNWGSYENPSALSPNTISKIKYIEVGTPDAPKMLFLDQGCMHCTEAACVEVCPTGALSHHSSGAVVFDRVKCNGCSYCSQFCPFSIPQIEGNIITGAGKSSKCTLCNDRVTNGLVPACVKTCPAGALSFGPRPEIVARGRQRVHRLASNGHPDASLYGDTTLGGLQRMSILTERPEVYGLPSNPQTPILAGFWQNVVQPLSEASFGLGILGTAVAFVIARRNIRMQEVD